MAISIKNNIITMNKDDLQEAINDWLIKHDVEGNLDAITSTIFSVGSLEDMIGTDIAVVITLPLEF
jgi:hypothetical protein